MLEALRIKMLMTSVLQQKCRPFLVQKSIPRWRPLLRYQQLLLPFVALSLLLNLLILWKYILCLIHCSQMFQCVFPHFYKPVICTNLLKFPSKVWSGTLTCTPCFSPPGSGEPGGRGLGQPGASEPPSHSAARRWDIFIMAWQTARFLPQRKGPNILSNPKVVQWQRRKLSVHLKDHNKIVAKKVVHPTFTLLVPSQTWYLSKILHRRNFRPNIYTVKVRHCSVRTYQRECIKHQ